MRKSVTELAAEVKRLRKKVAGLEKKANLWEQRYLDLALGADPAIRASIEAADREYGRKGGIPHEEVLRRIRAKVRRVRVIP